MDYEYLIFDLDGTLLDYRKSQEKAMEMVITDQGLSFNEYISDYLRELSLKEWRKAGLHNRMGTDIQNRYHELYRGYLFEFFHKLQEAFSLVKTPDELVASYLKALSGQAPLFPDAEETCRELSRHFFLYLAANGLLEVQAGRMEVLRPYFRKLFISEHLGHIKPSRDFFNILLDSPHMEPSKCLMIGDSLSSDILGGGNAGMRTCWFNPKKRNNMTLIRPDFEIHSLKELLTLIP